MKHKNTKRKNTKKQASRTKKTRSYVKSTDKTNVSERDTDFPYAYKLMQSPLNMFKDLKNTRIVTLDDKNKKYVKIIQRSYDKDYYKTDGISNHFTENIRMQCKFGTNKSPVESWTEIKKDITEKCGSKNIKCMNDSLYNLRMCTTFNPVIMMYFIRLVASMQNISTKQIKVLDPSAGWGDRLIGALACEVVQYHGYDPNSGLQKGYNNILSTLSPSLLSPKPQQLEQSKVSKVSIGDNYRVIPKGFEDAKITIGGYNLVLTSPPFFSLERYPGEGSNHIKDEPDYDKWVNGFYIKYLENAWKGVCLGGLLVIYIDNIGVHKLSDDTKKFVDNIINKQGDRAIFKLYGFRSEYKSRIRNILVWEKLGIKNREHMESVMNPPLIVSRFNINKSYEDKRQVIVFRDDVLIGGTKQRGLYEYMVQYILKYNNTNTNTNTNKDKNRNKNKNKIHDNKSTLEFIYASPRQGYAQIALSYVAKICNVRATIILGATSNNKLSEQSVKAKQYGANIIQLKYPNRLEDLQKYAKEYESRTINSILLPFGLDDSKFEELLTINIEKALKDIVKPEAVKRMWLVGGSGTILKCLSKIFRDCEFQVVQVGKKLWPDQLGKEGKNIFMANLYVAPEDFAQNASKPPPYPSVTNYDAKLWQFVLKYGRDGDYIWNVGG